MTWRQLGGQLAGMVPVPIALELDAVNDLRIRQIDALESFERKGRKADAAEGCQE